MTLTLTERNFAGLKVEKASDLAFSFNMLLFGDAGVGKTWLAGSADAVPEMRKVLYLNIEAGANTLKKEWPNVECVPINKWKELEDVYYALLAGGHDYRTVVLDSLTEGNDYAIEAIGGEHKLRDPDFDGVLDIRDWGKVQSKVLRLVRQYRDLPMCTIFVAHALEEKDKLTGKTHKRPLLTGKLSVKLPTIPDLVFYMYMVDYGNAGLRRQVLTSKTETTAAKARGVDLPQVLGELEPVTMKQLYDFIQASKGVKE